MLLKISWISILRKREAIPNSLVKTGATQLNAAGDQETMDFLTTVSADANVQFSQKDYHIQRVAKNFLYGNRSREFKVAEKCAI